MLEIRPFINSDLPHLARLWVTHHATYRPPPAVTVAVWEQAVVSRHFFRPERLLVATDASGPLAWCQWFDAGDGQAHLVALCFDDSRPAAEAARTLLDQCLQQMAAAGSDHVQAGVHDDVRWGYQGLDPIGQGIGIATADQRSGQLLSRAGFQAGQPIDRWEIQTADFRAPFSREALAFHRSTRIASRPLPPATPATAAAMFHLDIQRFDLVSTSGETPPLASAEVWISDPETQVMATDQAILGRIGGGTDNDDTDSSLPTASRPTASYPGAALGHSSGRSRAASPEAAIRYLVGQVIGQLASKRIGVLMRSVAADQSDEIARWQALKFQRTARGQLMTRSL